MAISSRRLTRAWHAATPAPRRPAEPRVHTTLGGAYPIARPRCGQTGGTGAVCWAICATDSPPRSHRRAAQNVARDSTLHPAAVGRAAHQFAVLHDDLAAQDRHHRVALAGE